MSKYRVSPMVSTARLVYSLVEPQREGRRAGVGSGTSPFAAGVCLLQSCVGRCRVSFLTIVSAPYGRPRHYLRQAFEELQIPSRMSPCREGRGA
jgi:hypothetical protein